MIARLRETIAKGGKLLQTLPSSEQGNMAKLLAQGWVDKNATAALDWATSLPPGEIRTQAILGLLEQSYQLPAGSAQRLFQQVPEILGADESGRMVWQLVNGGVEPAEFLPHLATVEKLAGALGVTASGLVVRGEAVQRAQLVRGIELAAIAC